MLSKQADELDKKLLIVPEGIEMKACVRRSIRRSCLLIVPEGIEIGYSRHGKGYHKTLLIVPEGIEMILLMKRLLSVRFF